MIFTHTEGSPAISWPGNRQKLVLAGFDVAGRTTSESFRFAVTLPGCCRSTPSSIVCGKKPNNSRCSDYRDLRQLLSLNPETASGGRSTRME